MPELIDRELTLLLIEGIIKHYGENWLQDKLTKNGLLIAKQIVSKQPTIEAEPVRRGSWIPDNHGVVVCTVCRYTQQIGAKDFCGKCGAKMDLRTPTEAALDIADSVMMGGAEQ